MISITLNKEIYRTFMHVCNPSKIFSSLFGPQYQLNEYTITTEETTEYYDNIMYFFNSVDEYLNFLTKRANNEEIEYLIAGTKHTKNCIGIFPGQTKRYLNELVLLPPDDCEYTPETRKYIEQVKDYCQRHYDNRYSILFYSRNKQSFITVYIQIMLTDDEIKSLNKKYLFETLQNKKINYNIYYLTQIDNDKPLIEPEIKYEHTNS